MEWIAFVVIIILVIVLGWFRGEVAKYKSAFETLAAQREQDLDAAYTEGVKDGRQLEQNRIMGELSRR